VLSELFASPQAPVPIPALALTAKVLVFGGAAAGLTLSNHRLVGGLFSSWSC